MVEIRFVYITSQPFKRFDFTLQQGKRCTLHSQSSPMRRCQLSINKYINIVMVVNISGIIELWSGNSDTTLEEIFEYSGD